MTLSAQSVRMVAAVVRGTGAVAGVVTRPAGVAGACGARVQRGETFDHAVVVGVVAERGQREQECQQK